MVILTDYHHRTHLFSLYNTFVKRLGWKLVVCDNGMWPRFPLSDFPFVDHVRSHNEITPDFLLCTKKEHIPGWLELACKIDAIPIFSSGTYIHDGWWDGDSDVDWSRWVCLSLNLPQYVQTPIQNKMVAVFDFGIDAYKIFHVLPELPTISCLNQMFYTEESILWDDITTLGQMRCPSLQFRVYGKEHIKHGRTCGVDEVKRSGVHDTNIPQIHFTNTILLTSRGIGTVENAMMESLAAGRPIATNYDDWKMNPCLASSFLREGLNFLPTETSATSYIDIMLDWTRKDRNNVCQKAHKLFHQWIDIQGETERIYNFLVNARSNHGN